MTREESTAIVDRIKIYRQNFIVDKVVYKEWARVLSPYDFEDVDKKLDEYFQLEENSRRFPDPFYLTRYLKTKEQKSNNPDISVICPLCCKNIKPKEYKKHYDRCSSALYIVENSRKYLGKTISYSKLLSCPQKTFDEYYWKFCKELYEQIPEGLLKHLLEGAIRAHEGLEPKYQIESLVLELSGNVENR